MSFGGARESHLQNANQKGNMNLWLTPLTYLKQGSVILPFGLTFFLSAQKNN